MEEILEAENEIEQAISQLFRLEDVLEEICQEIKSLLGFDFAGISLVSLERNTIEAVHGIGIAKEWSGRAKHYLETDEDLRDIQADIVQTRRTKIISGWYKNFDRWIYDEFHHDRLVRVYTPILLIQDENGRVIEDWFERYQWKNTFAKQNPEGWCKVFDELALPDELEIISIGTVEAGYEDRNREIKDETVFELAKLLSRKAIDIWKAQLPWGLKVITEKARQIMKADSATLHFLYEPGNNNYIYQVFSGAVGWRFLKDCPPRQDGIGRQAIRERECKYIPDPSKGHRPLEIENLNRRAFDAGIKALAAFPLQVDSEYGGNNSCQEEVLFQQEVTYKEGVLYVDFQQEHQFKEEELRWGQLFANRAADAIRHAIIYEQRRDHEQLLTTLHSVAQSLADIPNKKDLLRRIAWDTLNLLASDIVTIYEYIQTEKCFITPADRAGRFKAEQEMPMKINENDVPAKLIGGKNNEYITSLCEHPIFKDSKFADLEGIKSVASVKLRVGEEVVGIMFINYRRIHDFTPEEIKIIETLASSAAISIKNQRWLTARSEIDRKIITTLDRDELLNLIIEQAVKLTGADFSSIRLLDPDRSKEMLITEAQYPKDRAIDENRIRTSTNEGITGWVAKHRLSALVDDVNNDRWKCFYKVSFPNTCSELCVPLLNKDGNLLGVLNVESHRIRAFDRKHQQMLEALSDQAVIGIQNVENKDRLVKMEAMATLGQLACFLTHKINNDVGAIRVFVRRLFNQIAGEGHKNALNKIAQIADQIIQEVDRMKNFIQDTSHPIDLHRVILSACENVKCPNNIVLEIPQKQENLLLVLGNEHPLIMVFDNLLNNAFDAMPRGGTLSIQINTLELVETDGKKWIEVKVRDTGKGIPKKHIDKIFDLGYTTKKTTTGMGWGLWLANYYVKSLGGYLTVESQLRQGTQFTVKLPVYRPKTSRQT